MKSLSGLQIVKYLSASFIVSVFAHGCSSPKDYQVQLDSDVCRCSCGYEKDMRSPCTHVLHFNNFLSGVW
ncbi:putative Zinc finger, SWIM-type [Plasmopara halstedii]